MNVTIYVAGRNICFKFKSYGYLNRIFNRTMYLSSKKKTLYMIRLLLSRVFEHNHTVALGTQQMYLQNNILRPLEISHHYLLSRVYSGSIDRAVGYPNCTIEVDRFNRTSFGFPMLSLQQAYAVLASEFSSRGVILNYNHQTQSIMVLRVKFLQIVCDLNLVNRLPIHLCIRASGCREQPRHFKTE